MKLSARNVLPGRVIAVSTGATTAHVKVELGSGLTIFSSIPNEAVGDLELKVGDTVSAVIKSSDVMIGKQAPEEPSSRSPDLANTSHARTRIAAAISLRDAARRRRP